MCHPNDVEEHANYEKFFKIAEEVVEDSEVMRDSNQMQPTTLGTHETVEEIQANDEDVDLTQEVNEEIQTDDEDVGFVDAYEDMYKNLCKLSKLNLMLIKNVESPELENSTLMPRPRSVMKIQKLHGKINQVGVFLTRNSHDEARVTTAFQ